MIWQMIYPPNNGGINQFLYFANGLSLYFYRTMIFMKKQFMLGAVFSAVCFLQTSAQIKNPSETTEKFATVFTYIKSM